MPTWSMFANSSTPRFSATEFCSDHPRGVGTSDWAPLSILDPALILLAEVQGVPIGVTFAVPDWPCPPPVTGSLHPAAVSLLRGVSLKAAVVILFGQKQYQRHERDSLGAELVRALGRRGYRSLAITWIGTDNAASRAQAHALNMRPIHDLTMYERLL